MDILKILLIIIFVSFVFGEIIRIPLFGGVIHPLELSVTLFVLFRLTNKNFLRDIVKNQFFKPLSVFIIVCLLSLLIHFSQLSSEQLLISFSYLVRFTLYSFFYFSLSNLDKQTKQFIKSLMILSGFSIVVLGYVQYFLYPSLKNLFYLGWDEHLYRLFSTFLDPNFIGAFLVLFFIFMLHVFIQKKNSKPQSLMIFILATILISIFLTYSRSAYIMLVVSTSVYFYFMNKKRWIFAIFSAMGLFLLIASPYFHIENINIFRTFSSRERLKTDAIALKIFEKNPVLGVGFNAYRYAQVRYGFRDTTDPTINHADSGTDNSLLFVLATTGVVGFLSYLYFWKKILHAMFGRLKNRPGSFPIVFIASIFGLFVDSLFINSLFYVSILFWVFVLLGVTENS